MLISGLNPGGTPSNNDFHMVRAPSSPHVGGPMQPQRGPASGMLHPPAGASPSRMGPHHNVAHGMPAQAQGNQAQTSVKLSFWLTLSLAKFPALFLKILN